MNDTLKCMVVLIAMKTFCKVIITINQEYNALLV